MAASKQKMLLIGLSVVMGVVIFFLFVDNDKRKKKIKELQKEIDENESLTKEIKGKLTELIRNNAEVEPQIASELGQIAALIEIKQDTSAVLKLAKIIENLLKELYKNDSKLKELANKGGRKKPSFADYIEHGKNEKVISAEDYHMLSVLKIIRNEEAHELNVKKEKSKLLASFVSSFTIILGLCKILKKKSLDSSIE